VVLGAGVEIGVNVVIHAGTVVEAGVRILDGAVLGKLPAHSAHTHIRREVSEPLVVGERATIGTGAIVFAGARVGAAALIADQAHIRELAVVGASSVVGRASAVGAQARLGERVRLQTNVWITDFTVLEDDVFVGPGAVTMNDNSMGRGAPGSPLNAPVLRRACRVGGGALLTPGVEVGEEAYVGAGAVVTADVPPRTLVAGVPARARRGL
jgi:acetyltransferase-like isoleucine patch superfamily enzyme